MDETQKTGEFLKWVNLIGLLSFLVSVFMGLIYILHGNLVYDIVFSLIAFGALWYLSSLLVDFKEKKKNVSDDTPEILAGIGYLIIALVCAFFIFHFINMDFNQKDNIKTEGIDKVNAARQVQDEYQKAVKGKANRFTTSVYTAARNFLNTPDYTNRAALVALTSTGISDADMNRYQRLRHSLVEREKFLSIANKVAADRSPIIEAKYELGNVSADFDSYCNNAMAVFENWQMLKVSYYYNNINAEAEKFGQAAKAKMPDFQYTPVAGKNLVIDNVFDSISNVSIGKILLIFGLIILLYLIILLPYITATRVRPPLKRNKNYEGEKTRIKGSVDV